VGLLLEAFTFCVGLHVFQYSILSQEASASRWRCAWYEKCDREEGWISSEVVGEKLRLNTRMVVENETDLKEKRPPSPRQLTFCLTINVRDMNVILLRLRPVPRNRWTVTLYCSRWLVIAHASFLDFYLLSSRMYKCNLNIIDVCSWLYNDSVNNLMIQNDYSYIFYVLYVPVYIPIL
jgi:hypothetical protein